MNAATLAAIGTEVPAALLRERARIVEETRNRASTNVGLRMLQAAYPDLTEEEWYYGTRPASAPDPDAVSTPSRACQCDSCDAPECEGTCESCDDRDCSQCHGDCDDDCETCHYLYDCCGYCEHCDSCHGDGRDEVCERDYCHECGHDCERG